MGDRRWFSCGALCAQLREAAECMPSLLVLDDLELLCPARADGPDAEAAAAGSAALVAWLRAALREYHARPNGRPPMPGQHPHCSLRSAHMLNTLI
jgi:hypothetical protein